MKYLSDTIKEFARELGFHKVGITTASQPPKSKYLREWLDNGFHGKMTWMEKNKVVRLDIQKIFPKARSVICVAHNYYTSPLLSPDKEYAKISRYAWGVDYHKIMKKKLKKLLDNIKKYDSAINGRICVDSAPILEKLWAEQAGLGWQGKNTNLITRDFGSWVFLGELIVDADLEYDQPGKDFCGKCQACVDACPTSALLYPYVLDARRCISYLTIEYWDEPIPKYLAKKMDNWVFGCDICQEVCPWNRFQKNSDEERYLPLQSNEQPILNNLAQINEQEYKQRFKKSPILRPGWKNFVRNIKTVLKIMNS
jgi:epoxyqueuosine reductase